MICDLSFDQNYKTATQTYQRNGISVRVSGIPAQAICPSCDNAILDWETAQDIEDLIAPIFKSSETHLAKASVTITFPEFIQTAK